LKARSPTGRCQPGKVGRCIEQITAQGHKLDSNSRKEIFDNLQSTEQESMNVSCLWHAGSNASLSGVQIAFNNRNARKVPRESAGCEEAGHAASEYDGVILRGREMLRSFLQDLSPRADNAQQRPINKPSIRQDEQVSPKNSVM
jgi:hypothetical protein